MPENLKRRTLLKRFTASAEIEINPLMVLPTGQGVSAIDALVSSVEN